MVGRRPPGVHLLLTSLILVISISVNLFFPAFLVLAWSVTGCSVIDAAAMKSAPYRPSFAAYTYETTITGTVSEIATACAAPLIRTFTIADVFTITDLNVGLTISHSYRGDLR